MNSFWNDLPAPFFVLAPMEAVTDVVFRHVVEQAGRPDVYFSEFTNATGWAHAGDKAIGGRLIKTDDEQPIVAQLWGSDPRAMSQLATHCRGLGYHGIDINMGCPDKSAIKGGGGAQMIRTPDIAVQMINAAKQSTLPVSVKTRLGYSRVEEWREWLTVLFQQNIVALTIHLRTKKEMSKVPAHFELIDDIVALRDELAPHTKLIINGDIDDRAHGEQLVRDHPGVDGVMIGRGVFRNPFCFRRSSIAIPSSTHPQTKSSETASRPTPIEYASVADGAADVSEDLSESSLTTPPNQDTNVRVAAGGAAPKIVRSENENFRGGPADRTRDDENEGAYGSITAEKIALLRLHLDLYDRYQPHLHRPFETLKRFFKIYVNSFDGAAELRDRLMHTKTTAEVRGVLEEFGL